ncbi:hypothetical protein [Levilactobacillus brevis]|uniref:hypothetical protein n=1 Tax=Levilactobacillus brevis TaxID=1580 RepID=UPI00057C97C9|nr:hypothetical protein [Levilactobacillus brevis]
MNNKKVFRQDFGDASGIKHKDGNWDGGDDGMNSKYVTQQELREVKENLSYKLDLLEAHLDTKFEKVHSNSLIQEISLHRWFIGTAISIIGVLIALHFI